MWIDNYYQVGGALDYQHPAYVKRQADEDLYQGLTKGEFCYVLNSRQMGKSSLRIQVMKKLKAQGTKCASIDLTRIGSDVTTDEWYGGIVSELLRGFSLSKQVDFRTWWQQWQVLSPMQRLGEFIAGVLLAELAGNIVIFIDEIDSILKVQFKDDFFALIRACYNQRGDNPDYKRLSFCLLGVATPSNLIGDKQQTPFNIGRAIQLHGFTFDEAKVALTQGLSEKMDDAEGVLQRVLFWTDGQPFLTQKLCRLVLEKGSVQQLEIDEIVEKFVIENWESQDEPEHLKTIRDRILANEQRASRLLGLYQQILAGGSIPADGSPEQLELQLTGLVVKQEDRLRVYNPIYAAVFNQRWVEQELAGLRPYSYAIASWISSECKDDSRLLRGQALQEALDWKIGKSLSLADDQFLTASQQLAWVEMQAFVEAERVRVAEARLAEQKRSARRQRYLLGVVNKALLGVTVLAAVTYLQYRQATYSELNAIATSAEALFTSGQKLDALIKAMRATRQLQGLGGANENTKITVMKVLQQAVDGVQEYNRLSGHSDGVWEVAFSPDGKIIATGSRDATIKLWQRDGSLIKTLIGHRATVVGIDFSPDGNILASGSGDKTIKLWTLDGKLLKTLSGHQAGIIGVAFSPDGKMIASASRDKTVKLWHRDGKLLYNLAGHQAPVVRIAFSPDGKTIASASDDKTVRLWTLDGKLLHTLIGHTDEVYGVAFSPDGKTIASASDDKTVRLWTPNGKLLHTLTGHGDEVYAVAFSPDGKIIASGSRDKTIKLWQRDGKLQTTLSGHSGEIWQVAFSPDGKTIASASNDSTVKLWRPRSPWLSSLSSHDAAVWKVAFSPDGKILASAGEDNTIKLWQSGADRQFRVFATLSGHIGGVRGVAFSPDGKIIASASWDNTVKLWHKDGKLIETLHGHTDAAIAVSFSPDSKILASAADDNAIALWRLDGKRWKTLKGHTAGVWEVAWSPDGTTIASASIDNNVKLWHRDGILLKTLEGHHAGVIGVAFSPDGNIIASASRDKTVHLWQKDGTLLKTLAGHSSGVNSVAFSPNSKIIASASDDRTVKLWRRDGSLLTTLSGHSSGVNGVAFSPDGLTLASASMDNTVMLWNLDRVLNLDQLLKSGCTWTRDYLQHNLEVDPSDRQACP